MSISTEITRLQNAKASIKSAIEDKGVTVPSSAKLDAYDDYIAQISTGTPIATFTMTASPTKTEYQTGEAISYTGATFRAVYENGAILDLTKSDVTFSPVEGTILSTAQTYTVIVTFETASTSFTVTASSLEIVTWANGTDAQIIAMIEADRAGSINLQDYWAVGDARTVTLSAMSATGVGESHASQSVSMVLMDSTCTGFTYAEATSSGRTTPRFMVGQRHSLNETGYMNSSNTNSGGWMNSARRTWCNSVYYNAIPSTLRSAFKQFTWKQGAGGGATSGLNTTSDYFALTPEKAIFGSVSYAFSDESALYSQWTHYQTSSNRIKNVNGSAALWWGCSPSSGYSDRFCLVSSDGSAGRNYASTTRGLAPFGCI